MPNPARVLANERAQLARNRRLAWLHYYIQIVFCELIEWIICFAKLYTSMKPASHQVEWLRFGIIARSHLIILVNDNTEPVYLSSVGLYGRRADIVISKYIFVSYCIDNSNSALAKIFCKMIL